MRTTIPKKPKIISSWNKTTGYINQENNISWRPNKIVKSKRGKL
jgi:hypothetical protein